MQTKRPFWLTFTASPVEDAGAAPEMQQAFAEAAEQPTEPEAAAEPAQQERKTFSKEDVNRARQEEKDKLYADLHGMRDELKELKALRAREEERVAAEQRAREEAERRAKEDEMDVRELLRTKEEEFRRQLEEERQERERALALLERERTYVQLQEYRAMRMRQEEDNIIPELRDLVGGESQDEIEASIAGLIQRSARIMDSVRSASQTARKDSTGARVTVPPAGLDTYTDGRTLSLDQIKAMSNDEYSKYRSSLLNKGGEGQGLFG